MQLNSTGVELRKSGKVQCCLPGAGAGDGGSVGQVEPGVALLKGHSFSSAG